MELAAISIVSVRTKASPISSVVSELFPTVPFMLFAEKEIFSLNKFI